MGGITYVRGLPAPCSYLCLQIEGGNNAQLALGVNAVARVQQAGSIHGSVVRILTAAGTITLDDTSILFNVIPGCGVMLQACKHHWLPHVPSRLLAIFDSAMACTHHQHEQLR